MPENLVLDTTCDVSSGLPPGRYQNCRVRGRIGQVSSTLRGLAPHHPAAGTSEIVRRIMRTQDLWVALSIQSFPYLHELASADRDSFVLLDAYLGECLEEWGASGGQLSARSIVLLDDCARTISRRFLLLDGGGQCYFGQFRLLARRIWHGGDVEQAYRQAEQVCCLG